VSTSGRSEAGARSLRVAACQAQPVWLDREATTAKVIALIEEAAAGGAELVVFPEAFLPGYPWWVSRSDGARFEADDQKLAYAYYLEQAVELGGPELTRIAEAAGEARTWVMLGSGERSGGTVYCTLLTIDPARGVVAAHRKLMPTYDERLVWGHGDGHGLRAHRIGALRVTGLNCWENLMPLARQALYAEGTDLHVGLWPGSEEQARWMTRFIAYEGRVWSISVCGIYDLADVPSDFPLASTLAAWEGEMPFRGGTAIARPGGEWLVEPVVGSERVVFADLELGPARAEHLSFDPSGHYARPDVFSLVVNRERRQSASFRDDA
jgi:nitrilase